MRYLWEQGIIKSEIAIEELFVPTHGRYDRWSGRAA